MGNIERLIWGGLLLSGVLALPAIGTFAQTASQTAYVPLAMWGGEVVINSTSWQQVTRTTYTSIPGLFAGIPVAANTTRKYYLVIRRADNQPGGNGSNWRFSCSGNWDGGTTVAGHGFTLASNWGNPDEGTTDWVQIPPAALNSSCSPAYWEIDAQMVNSGQLMRVMSVSMAAIDVAGATSPSYNQSSSGNDSYPPMSILYNNVWTTGPGGNVGIGTSAPAAALSIGGTGVSATGLYVNGSTPARVMQIQSAGSTAWNIGVGDSAGDYFTVGADTPNAFNILKSNGNVGIGTTGPTQKLEVNGNAQVDGALYFAGSSTPQTTPWTGVLCGGDYAEAVVASGAKKQYEPGDVLVLSSATTGSVEKSHEPYSTLVAGIYATKPGVIGRRQSLMKDADELPMAMVGIVPTKVTAENGPISQGDLLVTSSQTGYAMKGTDRARLVGAVLGKAMGSLTSGTGVIEVLVTLQ